ncbi:MAG: ABC transporter ATP-binding protein [Kineosporiaceae bacterium]
MNATLQVDGVTKRYGAVSALEEFSLSIAPGEVVGLVGHNGAGKTTLVEIVSGLTRPDAGRVVIEGLAPQWARGRVGVAPQHLALYPSITVREHLQLFGRLAGLRGAALRGVIDDLAVALRLIDILDRRTGVLSGGQQRRTQAATALVHRPSLLLLDEPTAGADLGTRRSLLDLVKQRAGEGAAVLYTTHYLPELDDLEATIAVVRNGRLVARGSLEELTADLPGHVRLTFHDGEVATIPTLDTTRTLLEEIARSQRGISAVEVAPPSLDELYRSLAVDDVA